MKNIKLTTSVLKHVVAKDKPFGVIGKMFIVDHYTYFTAHDQMLLPEMKTVLEEIEHTLNVFI